ncbi:hypothetical protein OXX69_013411, partial [Metschnikowia pulcherrima]
MAKRKISELAENAPIDEPVPSSNGELMHSHKQDIIADMIRMVLAKSSRHSKIRGEHFSSILQASNVKSALKPWIATLKIELESVYGLTLKSHTNEMMLVSNMNPESNAILHKLRSFDLSASEDSNFASSRSSLMPTLKRNKVIVNTHEQVFGGLTLLIVAMMILCGNKISDVDLIRYVTEFGISNNLSIQTPVFNKQVQEIIAELTKRGYIKKMSPSSTVLSGGAAEYTLGERSKQEFDPQS